MKNKKAQIGSSINTLVFASIVFIVLVIVVTVGAIVATNLKSTVNRDTLTIVNESDAVNLLWNNNTNMTLDNDELTAVSAVYNCTGSATIPATNYTVFLSEGKILATTNGTNGSAGTFPRDGTVICVNYSYSEKNSALNVSKQGESGMLTFSDFFGVITIVIVLVVIIGMMLGVITIFARNR